MKIRINYVSNSSSSSFVCNVCGNSESGYDCTVHDLGMCQCENGHIFCQYHKLEFKNTVELIKDYLIRNINIAYMSVSEKDEWEKFLNKNYSSVEELENDNDFEFYQQYNQDILYNGDDYHACPICQFDKLNKSDVLEYLLKKYSISMDDILSQLKEKFSSYDQFIKYLK